MHENDKSNCKSGISPEDVPSFERSSREIWPDVANRYRDGIKGQRPSKPSSTFLGPGLPVEFTLDYFRGQNWKEQKNCPWAGDSRSLEEILSSILPEKR
jgi:hypothetical protein